MANRAGHLELNSTLIFFPGCGSVPVKEPEYQVPSHLPTTPATDASNVITATNVAYAATSVSAYQPVVPPQESDINASANSAYQPVAPPQEGDITASANLAYQPVVPPQESDITASANLAYQPVVPPQESDITASVNLAYQLMVPSRDIATATNVAYVATDINASVNPAYRPLQGTSDSTSESMYDYARL